MINVALDFDKTIHRFEKDYNGNRDLCKLDEPLWPMIETVKKCLESGNYKFTIFTARLSHGEPTDTEQRILIQDWLEKYGLPRFDVTAIKYPHFDEFWDDKAVEVIKGVGKFRNKYFS